MYTYNINMDMFVCTQVFIWRNVSWSIIVYLEMQSPYLMISSLGVQFQSFVSEEAFLLPEASFKIYTS
jgi:hypothetical protein